VGRKGWTVVAGISVVALALIGWVASRPAAVTLSGTTHEIAVPAPHLCFDQGPGRAACFVVGDYALGRFLSERAGAQGWRYEGQLGSGHLLSKGPLRLSVARRQRGGPFLVELSIQLSPATVAP